MCIWNHESVCGVQNHLSDTYIGIIRRTWGHWCVLTSYFNEMYSPTIRFTSICLILSTACRYGLELYHVDVKGAYLNGKLEDDVYMDQPDGFIEEGKEASVCKLNKGLYGLKQSG